MLGTVRRELGLIARHRQVAHGALRTELLAVEARWTEFAAFLANDTGDALARDAWTDRALRLADQAGNPDVAALTRMRQAQWAVQGVTDGGRWRSLKMRFVFRARAR